MNKVHFSSNSNEWATPQPFYDRLHHEFGFTLDPCASVKNAKCDRFFTEEIDGLAQSWADQTVFMNPPYGRGIGKWIEKAHLSARDENATVVVLMPVRSDTPYWHDHVMGGAAEIRFVRGRLKFTGGPKENPMSHNAPFPCAVVVFRPSKRYPPPWARTWDR